MHSASLIQTSAPITLQKPYNMTDNEILNNLKSNLTRYDIVRGAIKDGEKPMGFLLTYMKDMYCIPKTQGFGIAEKLLEFYNIDNEVEPT